MKLLLKIYASYFYSKLINDFDSPIDSMKVRTIQDGLGAKYFESIIYLKKKHRNEIIDNFNIYSNSDGGGASVDKSVACNKGISEALERWAFYYSVQNSHQNRHLGLNVDKSTTGFACAPGANLKTARSFAIAEAQERYLLQAFCRKELNFQSTTLLKSRAGKIEIFKFRGPFKKNLFIATHHSPVLEKYVYGFSSGTPRNALLEMRRNLHAFKLKSHLNLSDLESIIEKRLFYFSTNDGHDLFRSIIKQNSKKTAIPNPILIVDTQVNGPWNDYAAVWRALYHPLIPELQNNDETLFYF